MMPIILFVRTKRRASAAKKRASLGFTLVEVLIAIAILASGLVIVIEGMARSQQALRISENLASASQIAEEEIAKSALLIKQGQKLDFSSESGRVPLPGRVFEWTRRTQSFSDKAILNESKMNKVEINLRWKDGPDRANEVKVATLFAAREKKEAS